jgi:hypothetical protein
MKSLTQSLKRRGKTLTLTIAMLSMHGCATTSTRALLDEAKTLSFQGQQKRFVGKLLHRINDLERDRK